jgi:cell division protein FtsB
MVTRPRLRSFFTGLGLYLLAAALIGYFGLNAYTGDHGLRAREQMDKQIATLTNDLAQASAERDTLQRRIKLLKSDSVDPDMLDERARQVLDYADPHDLVLMQAHR